MTVTYFVDDKLGGVTSLNLNLIKNCSDSAITQRVIHIKQLGLDMTRANVIYPAAENVYFAFSGKENYYHVLRRLSKQINIQCEGALVLNYDTEMAMLDHYPAKQTTYQLVHDDYNVELAKKYKHLVDVFICHNTVIYQKLINLFPERISSIFFLPHGVRIPEKFRRNETDLSPNSLRLLFIGRMVASKGIFDLPMINEELRKRDIKFEWTCIGDGPELEKLKQVWNPLDRVLFLTPTTNEEVLDISSNHDVFVLPTKFEGSPVSLLEAMSVGLVPVVSKIAGGITDTITPENGFVVEVDNNLGFADEIAKLYHDRLLLNKLSANARMKIVSRHDVKTTAKNYHQLFLRSKEFYLEKNVKKIKVGARLDQPFIPSAFVKFVRTLRERNG
jgi:glycosyltransferase involved in cell wall biosynthesis